jgi:hypothetical protein
MTTKATKKTPRKRAAKRSPTKKAASKRTPKKAPAKRPSKVKTAPAQRAPTTDAPAKTATTDTAPRSRDPRLPKPGAILTRTFQGKEIRVEVLDAGFAYDGRTWRSLSAIAKEISGTSWNGYLFFSLQTRAKKDGAQ